MLINIFIQTSLQKLGKDTVRMITAENWRIRANDKLLVNFLKVREEMIHEGSLSVRDVTSDIYFFLFAVYLPYLFFMVSVLRVTVIVTIVTDYSAEAGRSIAIRSGSPWNDAVEYSIEASALSGRKRANIVLREREGERENTWKREKKVGVR